MPDLPKPRLYRSRCPVVVSLLASVAICLMIQTVYPCWGEEPAARSSEPLSGRIDRDRLAKVRPAVQELIDAKRIPGAVVLVARNGEIVLANAVGFRNIDDKAPMEKETLFRIYSMTKPITSVAVMMLVEQGKLSPTDPVAKYLPELGHVQVFAGMKDGEPVLEPPRRPMTIADLLRHTSGLTYGFFGNTYIDQRYREVDVLDRQSTLAEMVEKLGKIPLLHHPGERFAYSVSTDVLGRVIEVVSGRPLDTFFQEQIFGPLAMNDTGFFVPPANVSRFAANYRPAVLGGLALLDDPKTSEFLAKPKLLSGGGGLVSTAPDYLRFCQMLLNQGELDGKRLLKASTVYQMTTNQLPAQAYPISVGGPVREGIGFGFGFSVVVEKTEYTGPMRLGEYGWGGAASTHFWISPRDQLAVVANTQVMPFTFLLENTVKTIVYDALPSDAPPGEVRTTESTK